MDWHLPLVISALIFAAFLVFKLRPAMGENGRTRAAGLKAAQERLAAAKGERERAAALCDAAEACASLGRTGAAISYWVRAMRTDPTSVPIVERAASSLAHRPGAIEKVMWRKLADTPWTGEGRDATAAALKALSSAYSRKPKFHPRARALAHALEVITPATEGER
ncbi:hypothetical protein AKJ09_02776 [Labilithrix luteola]|uniref:Tetratricopeptide repeat protein n=1 Tax=Labilithrix luteola TaxID=1391654 RepID=A0A0K1PRG3_9BACT|nr:hypothetical protein [Labilithrix luteola]AKU96112.1 hypothetical protein AKJ09_02776 [Labilithrix luteola]